MSSSDVSQQINQAVESVCAEILSENPHLEKSNIIQRFLEAFQENLVIAVNEAYFGEDQGAVEPEDAEAEAEKEKAQYETLMVDLAKRRRAATKHCREALEKTLNRERKILPLTRVNLGVSCSSKSSDESSALLRGAREDLRVGCRQIAQHLKAATSQSVAVAERTQELTQAARIFYNSGDSFLE